MGKLRKISFLIRLWDIIVKMTEDEVVRTLQEHFESLFPRACPNCDRTYASLRDYILVTKRMGPPISVDMELGNWNTELPIGTVALANCPCGSTIALSTVTMRLPLRLELLNWMRIEVQRRGVGPAELLEYLRDRVRSRVLGSPIPKSA